MHNLNGEGKGDSVAGGEGEKEIRKKEREKSAWIKKQKQNYVLVFKWRMQQF